MRIPVVLTNCSLFLGCGGSSPAEPPSPEPIAEQPITTAVDDPLIGTWQCIDIRWGGGEMSRNSPNKMHRSMLETLEDCRLIFKANEAFVYVHSDGTELHGGWLRDRHGVMVSEDLFGAFEVNQNVYLEGDLLVTKPNGNGVSWVMRKVAQ